MTQNTNNRQPKRPANELTPPWDSLSNLDSRPLPKRNRYSIYDGDWPSPAYSPVLGDDDDFTLTSAPPKPSASNILTTKKTKHVRVGPDFVFSDEESRTQTDELKSNGDGSSLGDDIFDVITERRPTVDLTTPEEAPTTHPTTPAPVVSSAVPPGRRPKAPRARKVTMGFGPTRRTVPDMSGYLDNVNAELTTGFFTTSDEEKAAVLNVANPSSRPTVAVATTSADSIDEPSVPTPAPPSYPAATPTPTTRPAPQLRRMGPNLIHPVFRCTTTIPMYGIPCRSVPSRSAARAFFNPLQLVQAERETRRRTHQHSAQPANDVLVGDAGVGRSTVSSNLAARQPNRRARGQSGARRSQHSRTPNSLYFFRDINLESSGARQLNLCFDESFPSVPRGGIPTIFYAKIGTKISFVDNDGDTSLHRGFEGDFAVQAKCVLTSGRMGIWKIPMDSGFVAVGLQRACQEVCRLQSGRLLACMSSEADRTMWRRQMVIDQRAIEATQLGGLTRRDGTTIVLPDQPRRLSTFIAANRTVIGIGAASTSILVSSDTCWSPMLAAFSSLLGEDFMGLYLVHLAGCIPFNLKPADFLSSTSIIDRATFASLTNARTLPLFLGGSIIQSTSCEIMDTRPDTLRLMGKGEDFFLGFRHADANPSVSIHAQPVKLRDNSARVTSTCALLILSRRPRDLGRGQNPINTTEPSW